MPNTNTTNAIILGYRNLIMERYEYTLLQQKYAEANTFGAQKIDRFRDYFLGYVYPHPEKRAELDEAFEHLDSYIQQPRKLLRILLDSARLLFKYGRHLPKILTAGLQALKSFRTGSNFEQKLVQKASELAVEAPFDSSELKTLITALPRTDIEQFITESESLLSTLHDRKLIQKIIEIVEHLIINMRKRPKLYSPAEIRGLEIGRNIIKEGNSLFEELTLDEQRQIFKLIITIERDFLEELFA